MIEKEEVERLSFVSQSFRNDRRRPVHSNPGLPRAEISVIILCVANRYDNNYNYDTYIESMELSRSAFN